MESSIKKLSIMIEWTELKEQASWVYILTLIYAVWPREKHFTHQVINLPEHVQKLGYIAEMQVSVYKEYNKGLSNIKRIHLFLHINIYRDADTSHLIIWPASHPE